MRHRAVRQAHCAPTFQRAAQPRPDFRAARALGRMTTRSSDEEESAPATVNYVVHPHARLRGADSPAIEYLYDNHQGAIYND